MLFKKISNSIYIFLYSNCIMVKLENLNEEERGAIEELRTRVKSVLSPDSFQDDVLFYRFLKARKFDVSKAEAMLKKHVIYRKAMQLDSILETFKPKEVFLKYFCGSCIGEDKEGYPVRVLQLGRIHPIDYMSCFKSNSYWRHLLWMAEVDIDRLKKISKNNSKPVWQVTYIFDMLDTNFSALCHPMTASYLRLIGQTYQDYYPEVLHKAYIINAPAYFVILLNVLKTVLSDETLKKINVYGKSGWKDKLLQDIDADILPSFLGGNRTDPDGNPMCYTFGCNEKKIPITYYMSKEEMSFKNPSLVQYVKIGPKDSFEIPIHVEESGTTIEWEFEIKSKDIGFGLYFKDLENNLKEILPIYRYETWYGTHDDSYRCKQKGTYIVTFDNKHSWWNSKEVSFVITVIKPENP